MSEYIEQYFKRYSHSLLILVILAISNVGANSIMLYVVQKGEGVEVFVGVEGFEDDVARLNPAKAR